MDTLDEQLETAQAKIAEQDARITALGDENAALTAANEELKANLAHAQEQLAASDAACAQANAEVQQLKAEAKSAEERAAEYYGAPAKPQQVTAKGDPEATSVLDRFKAITDPARQTAFLRSLTDAERAELYSNL